VLLVELLREDTLPGVRDWPPAHPHPWGSLQEGRPGEAPRVQVRLRADAPVAVEAKLAAAGLSSRNLGSRGPASSGLRDMPDCGQADRTASWARPIGACLIADMPTCSSLDFTVGFAK